MQSIDEAPPTQRYYPYGEQRGTSQAATDYRYTGQREEDEIGLYYYDARWYDPALGRFIQPDTIVPQASNTQTLNRYSYVLNNPLKYTDPTGRLHDPSADYGIGNEYAFGNLSSHPAYRGQWFAENTRFEWATEFDYQEHLWLGGLGYYEDVRMLYDYTQVRDILQREPRYGDLSRCIGQDGGANSLWHSLLGWVGIYIGLLPSDRLVPLFVQKYPDDMIIIWTVMIPPDTGGWTLGNVVGLASDCYFQQYDPLYINIHEYVHVLQYRTGQLTVSYHIQTSSYDWTTPHEQQAIDIQRIYQQNEQLAAPWYFVPGAY